MNASDFLYEKYGIAVTEHNKLPVVIKPMDLLKYMEEYAALRQPPVICSACGAEESIHWDKREIGIDDKYGSYLDLTFRYCDQCGNVTDVDLS